MQFEDLELREQRRDGERIVELDGYNRLRTESKPAEYRRVALVDLTEAQVRELHARLGELIDEWDERD